MKKVGDILARMDPEQRGRVEKIREAGHDGALAFSTDGSVDMIDFKKPVKFASDCSECPDCGEPWCDDCEEHYSDCSCPGPHSEPEE